MRFLKTSRGVSVLFLLMLLISCGTVVALSANSVTDLTGDSPIRLRLKVAKSTLRSGEATSVWIEFLDRDYQKVQNDGTRTVVFKVDPRRRSAGYISEREVVVRRGEWSGGTMFTAGEPGSAVVISESEGLNSDETTLVVTKPAASWLSRLLGMFETVAYAQNSEFKLKPSEKTTAANKKGARLDFQLSWAPPPAADTTVRITTDPPSKILYNGKESDGTVDILLGPEKGASDDISIISSQEGKITVTANAAGHGKQASATAYFTKPVAEKIIFKAEPKEIPPGDNVIRIALQVTDQGGHPVESGKDRKLSFWKGNDKDQVEFQPSSEVDISSDDKFVETSIHLNEMPAGTEIRIGASSKGLESGSKTIAILRPVKALRLTGPPEVMLGKTGELTLELLDKDGNLVSTDRDRTINLTASHGTLSPALVTIPKGQSVAKVRYVASGSAAKAVINANSEGIGAASLQVPLLIALYWLVIVALVGGLVGGVIRHTSKNGYKLPRILPCWTGDCWDLGLVGKLAVSIVGGLIMYLIVKLGFYRVIGSLPLPEALDIGTKLVAFFFGVIGGFAGIYLFDWILSKFLPGAHQEPAPAA
jgi:hypothetical protein